MNFGIAVDLSVVSNTGKVAYFGVAIDSSFAVDFGVVVDLGVAIDSNHVVDFGVVVDLGVAIDSNHVVDFGVVVDFSVTRDFGFVVDHGVAVDFGVVEDFSTVGDFGVVVDFSVTVDPTFSTVGKVRFFLDPAAEIFCFDACFRNINKSFDLVLSVNGFHVFPNKSKAYIETWRMLRCGGIFCGCMYVRGENHITDLFVRQFCQRHELFCPPYETAESLKRRLEGLYEQVELSLVGSFAGFVCRK